MTMVRRLLLLSVVILCGIVPAGVAAEKRYLAEFADGARLEADLMDGWNVVPPQPRIAERPLWDAPSPVRWIVNRLLPPREPPAAFLEFFGGDILPGQVIAGRTGSESPYDRAPPYLEVAGGDGWDLPESLPRRGPVRIPTRWIKRVVWARRIQSRYEPGTLFFADQRRIMFRAVRWNPTSVTLLLDAETVEVPFPDIAELHLPREDNWNAYLDQLAILTPDGTSRLVHLETEGGFRALTNRERIQTVIHGGKDDPASWYHLVQPAWSLDPFWIRHSRVRTWRSFAPHEVPLTVFDPETQPPAAGSPGLGLSGDLPWQRDRNTEGQPLRSGGTEAGWGFGVHAPQTLGFPLPQGTRAFRTRIGLDRSIGTGGCARGVIQCGPETAPLFRTELLIGSTTAVDSAWIPLPTAGAGGQRLFLTADPAHADRPPGADPFDIRDRLDWLDPQLELDPAQLAAAIRTRGAVVIPAWDGWTLDNTTATPLQAATVWDEIDPRDARYVTVFRTRLPIATWTRKVQVTSRENWLVIVASRFAKGSQPSMLQVRIDGAPTREFDIPERNSAVRPEPLLVPLHAYRGREITIEVSHLAGGPDATVLWEGVTLQEQHPGVRPLFDDDESLANALTMGDADATIDRDDPYSGTGALRIVGAERGTTELPGWNAVIREHPRLGEYRYLVFAWKKQGGTRICLQLASDGLFGDLTDERASLRYDAGQGPPSFGAARRLDPKLPEEWTVIYRDLYADFGNLTITGANFAAVDGEAARFDRVYLARTDADLKRGPTPPQLQPLPLLEDQAFWASRLDQGSAQVALDPAEKYSGQRSLKVVRDHKFNAALFGAGVRICENPGPHEYRYARFAWKKQGGKNVLIHWIGTRNTLDPATEITHRHEAGTAANIWGLPAVRVAETLPEEWTVVTRDLFADFGEFTLTGMGFAPQEGEAAWFDHIYLGRTPADLDLAAPAPKEEKQ